MTMPQDREAVAEEVAAQRKLDETAAAEADKAAAEASKPAAPPAPSK
jgi:hypothetical protein